LLIRDITVAKGPEPKLHVMPQAAISRSSIRSP
jgi:hypothetical protein